MLFRQKPRNPPRHESPTPKSSCDRALVTGDEHGVVRLWDVASLKQRTVVPAHEGWVKGLTVSSTGKTLVTGGNDGLVKVWDLPALSADHGRRR